MWNSDGFDAEFFEFGLGVRFFSFTGVGKAREDGDAIFDKCPVGGVDAILAVFWCRYVDDFDASLLEAVNDGGVFGHGFGDVDLFGGVIWVNFVIVGKEIGTRNEQFLINH